jgi:predicted GTPase
MSQSVMSSTASADSAQFRVVHILVMGLTGAGKSTFISKATGDDSIRVGSGLRSVTKEVAEYVLYYEGFEVHLIDSPGFDDGTMSDHIVFICTISPERGWAALGS